MRHDFALSATGPIPGLAGRMPTPPGATPALLIAAAGALERDPTGVSGAGPRAVPLATVTHTRHRKKSCPQSGRPQMIKHSESTRSRAQDARAGQPPDGMRRRERRIARSQVWVRQRARGGQTPGPHPVASSAGTVYLNSRSPATGPSRGRSKIPPFLVMVNTTSAPTSIASGRHSPRTSVGRTIERPASWPASGGSPPARARATGRRSWIGRGTAGRRERRHDGLERLQQPAPSRLEGNDGTPLRARGRVALFWHRGEAAETRAPCECAS